MVDVRGDVLRPPHGTTPAAVKANIKSEMRSFKSNENIHKKGHSLSLNGKQIFQFGSLATAQIHFNLDIYVFGKMLLFLFFFFFRKNSSTGENNFLEFYNSHVIWSSV